MSSLLGLDGAQWWTGSWNYGPFPLLSCFLSELLIAATEMNSEWTAFVRDRNSRHLLKADVGSTLIEKRHLLIKKARHSVIKRTSVINKKVK